MIVVNMASLTGTGTEDLTGPVVALGQYGRDTALIACDVGTSVTSVVVEGRINSTWQWQTLTSFSSTDASEVPILPEMRATITDANGLVKVSAVIVDGL